jgi:hypothetical protein
MIMTAEITMYPFQENFVPPIKSFVDKLATSAQSRTEITSAGAQSRTNITSAGKELQVDTFPTCTVLVGEYALIMDVLKEAMAWSHHELGKAVFVCKFIPGYQAD